MQEQPDLFSEPSRPPEVDAAFVAGIRADLEGMLQAARAAQVFPWRDFTQSALAEMRFDSLSNWLPAEEGEALRVAYAVELDRLYAL